MGKVWQREELFVKDEDEGRKEMTVNLIASLLILSAKEKKRKKDGEVREEKRKREG